MAAIPCRELRSRSTRAQHHWSDTAHASNHGEPMTSTDPRELVSRYVAVWNEPDPQQRREAIRDLWAKDRAHILQPQVADGLAALLRVGLVPDRHVAADELPRVGAGHGFSMVAGVGGVAPVMLRAGAAAPQFPAGNGRHDPDAVDTAV